MSIRTVIVDDEPLSRQRIRALLQDDPDVTVVGEFGDGSQALAALRHTPCDLLFLDVEMPLVNGLEVARRLGDGPAPVVIFVTAYDNYAVPAFEVHAADYLLKPFDRERFRRALAWAKDNLQREPDAGPAAPPAAHAGRPSPERLTIKSSGRIYFVKTQDVDWIEAARNYLRLHVGKEVHLLRETMNGLEAQLDPGRFWRINRGVIVNAERVRELQPLFHGDYAVLLHDGTQLTLTRNYRQGLGALFGAAP